MPERLSAAELHDVRRLLGDPAKQFWPKRIVEGLLDEVDRLTGLVGASTIERARERYDYARLNGGVPVDLDKAQLDREGLPWRCIGYFRARGETEEQPLLRSDRASDDYTLRALIEQRGPIRALQEHTTVLPADAPPQAPETGTAASKSAVRRLQAVREAQE